MEKDKFIMKSLLRCFDAGISVTFSHDVYKKGKLKTNFRKFTLRHQDSGISMISIYKPKITDVALSCQIVLSMNELLQRIEEETVSKN